MKRNQYLAFSSLVLSFLFLASFFWQTNIGVFDSLLGIILNIIEQTGYIGIFLAMVLDSAVLPIFPNEVIVPLSGFACSSIFEVVFLSILVSIANVVGSLIAYGIGRFLGRDFLIEFGKYFFVSKKNLQNAEKFFQEYGEETVFASRLMPAVKTIISFPAGMVKMNEVKFIYMTFFGSLLLNILLAFSGFFLGANWTIINQFLSNFELFFLGFGILLVIFIIKYS